MNGFSNTPRDRGMYTGESSRYLRNPNSPRSGASIPAASPDQELLEALVMQGILAGQGFLAHPLGVSHVRILPAGRLAVHLDPPERAKRVNPVDEQMALNLFPRRDRNELVGGVPGLRVVAMQHTAMTIGLAGTSARLTLVAHSGWTRWLARMKQEAVALRTHPLWEEREMTVAEQDWIQPWTRRSAWIGSGLLRRIGLLHSVANTYWVKGRPMGDLWKIEMFTHPGVNLNHEDLVNRLTDPQLGLPLKQKYCSCSCSHNLRYSPGCTVELAHRVDPRAGGLQLRLYVSPLGRDWGPRLADAGARSSWLERIGLR